MQKPPLFSREFSLLVCAQLLQSIGYASMILLPLYLEHLGASRQQIGTMMGAAAIGGLTLRPVVAWSLDAVGRRQTIFVGTAALVLGIGALGWVDRIGPAIYPIRALIGVGIGALFTGYFTFASDWVPQQRRTEGLAIFGIFGLLGLLVNPLAERFGLSGGALQGFFPVVAVIVGLSVFFVAAVPERPRPPAAPEAPPASLGAAWRGLTQAQMIPVWIATAVFATVVANYMTFATVAAGRSGFAHPASIWSAYAGGAVLVRLFGARVPDRYGPRNFVAPSLGFYVVALVIAGAGPSGWMLSGLLAGIGHGYCFPVLTSQVVSRVPPAFTGTGIAVFTGLWELARLVATPLFGALADALGDAAMFGATAVAATAGLALWVVAEARWGKVAREGTRGG